MGSPSILTSPVFNIALLLLSMQLAKKVDWTDPQVTLIMRVAYCCAQIIVIGGAYALINLIKKKNGK
jgi:hypothetical protein